MCFVKDLRDFTNFKILLLRYKIKINIHKLHVFEELIICYLYRFKTIVRNQT